MALQLCLTAIVVGITGGVLAQPHVRQEDHFYRRRVVNRIDLSEKINQPLIQSLSHIYGDLSQTNRGIVGILMQGLKEGKVVAYHPDSSSIPLSYEQVVRRMQDFSFTPDVFSEGEEEPIWDDFPEEEEEWIVEEEIADSELSGGIDPLSDLGPYETVIQFVEDRLFDKNRSEMVYHIDYFQIIWSDPGETLPEKYLVNFRYKDVMDLMDEAIWVNRFNDAEQRTLKEIFDLRLFNSYIINVSGHGVRSLPEAELRRQALVEYEHHLWHY